MTVWLKLSEKDLQLSAVFVVTVFFQGKRSRRDLKFSTQCRLHLLKKSMYSFGLQQPLYKKLSDESIAVQRMTHPSDAS